ncbi:hypothetical protein PRUPE_1G582800 [Prunus persica]|uniref:Zinc finger PHD-type domain-containing protein n=1 Tax=Prunus persica TaxID=3760 RepID=A0A251RKY8_PRUPE|nr:hypothetical protein PRUPE_1G582800 [Prunus persica]ONI36368.1 hypothetical protein PRUPE_1G582800 [Prunus persica]ONI36369.1 hypothetical protein PRUPE_1G582800 [Prunus persica]ONI36370.1 hypothetical protein PRUPE_1G582800 [Prunus persica]
MPRKNKRRKEEICEDYCFACKDGGDVRVCDYKDCLKVYHPQCVGKDDSFLKSKDRWTCNWHSCFICHKTAKFHCFCCPKGVCGICLWDAEFALVKGGEGFCSHCLKLAILIEEKLDVDSDGGKVDFKERNTLEFLFQEYWQIIKEKQGLSAEHVHYAKNLLKSGKEEYMPVSKKKRSKGKLSAMKRKVKAKKIEFIGWGSKSLLSFLTSIGKDTSKELSQNEVTTVVTNYCKENNLFDPQKRKKVIFDAMLQSLLGKKSTSVNRIYNLLTAHFCDNLELTEDDETGSSSEDKDQNFMVTCKRQNKLISDGQPQKKKVVPNVRKSCFASVIAENIKLLYLKRSLVEKLLKQPETFDEKVVGSFVRVKFDPNDYSQKNSHQLLQVKGIKKTSRTGVMNTEVFLQFSNMSKDVPIGKLSDDDFCQEECEDLHQRVKDGLLRRPTVAELELKARRLHEDIMKHWIGRELSLLQKRIDKANEKGWRRELAQYMDKKLLLEMPSEQSRLLNEVPEVITDIENFEPTLENSPSHDKRQHDGLPEALRGSSQTPSSDKRENFEPTPENSPSHDKREHDGLPEALRGSSQILSSGLANGTLYYPKGGIDPADISKFGSALENSSSQDKQENDGSPFSAIKGPSQTPSTDLANGTLCYPNGRTDPAEVQGGIHHGRHRQYVHVEKKSSKVLFPKALEQKSLDFASKGQPDVSQQKPHHFSSGIVGERPSAPEDVQHKVKNQSTSEAEFIELSDDDEDVRGEIVAPAFEDPYSALWHCVSPLGDTRGPFKMSLLKQWNDSSDRELKFKVWREGQTKEEAIFLTDAIRQNFPGT